MADPDYFTAVEFLALPDMTSLGPSNPTILGAAAALTSIVEREVGAPFVPRVFVDTLNGNGQAGLVLNQTHVVTITGVTVSGVAVDVTQLRAVSGVLRYINPQGYVTGYPWFPGAGNVVVTYTAGQYATCPADVKDAVMWATRDKILTQGSAAGVNARRTSVSTAQGVETYLLPGEKRPTGYPPLDAVIASYQRVTPLYGFA